MNSTVMLETAKSLALSEPFSEIIWRKVWMYQSRSLVFDFQVYDHRFALDVSVSAGIVEFSVTGRSDDGRRVLRNALVGEFPMIKRQGERHVLWRTEGISLDSSAVLREARYWLKRVSRNVQTVLHATTFTDGALPDGMLNLFWWDDRPNFGDAIGPYLAAKISGGRTVNGRGKRLGTPPVAVVGSIAGWIEQDGTSIWGSGLMAPLGANDSSRLASLRDVSVLAVRGKNTAAELKTKLGWNVPEVYGDPALLLPRFLAVRKEEQPGAPIAVVPHLSHANYFVDAASDEICVIDVEEGLEKVTQQIASAGVCISSSLHGIIVAQAYGIPWIWLRLTDHPLGGDTFKFDDFFTTLERPSVSSLSIDSADLSRDFLIALADRAALPKLTISLEPLMDSFPFEDRNKERPSYRLHTVL